jgi:hypothetical protein
MLTAGWEILKFRANELCKSNGNTLEPTSPPHPPLSPHRGERIKVRGANVKPVVIPLFMQTSIAISEQQSATEGQIADADC